MFNLVADMHVAFQNKIRKELYIPLEKDDKEISLRVSLIAEEFNETIQAINENNITEVVDGFCDLAVVAIGAGLTIGYINPTPWETSSNIVKLVNKTSDIGVLFNTINSFINTFKTEQDYSNFILLQDLIDYCLILFRYIDMVYKHYNLFDNFKEVMSSNMSKLCDNEDIAKKSVEWYKEEKNINTTYEYNDKIQKYIVRREDGKFLKSINWKTPNLKIQNNE